MTTPRQPHPSSGPIPGGFGRRRFLRALGGAGGAIVVGRFLTACGGDDAAAPVTTATAGTAAPTTAAAGGSRGTIGLSLNGVVEYTKGVASGVYEALEGTGYDLVVVQANFDAGTETANLESLVAQGVAGLVIQPNTAEGAAAGAQLAAEAGIPVSNCLWPGPSSSDEFFVGVAALDSVEGGRLIGRWLVDNVEPGPIVVVQGVVGQGFSERIDEGLDEILDGTGFEVVVRQQGFFDRAQAVNVVQDAYIANPDIVAIVDYAATMSNGISAWMQDEGLDGIAHVTSDADEEMMSWITTPYLAATRYYSSAETGLIAARAVLTALDGGTPEFETPISQVIATAENIDAVVAANPFFFEAHANAVASI